MSKKAVILLADGFEEVEALGSCDVLRRCGVDVTLARVGAGSEAVGAHRITVKADCNYADLCGAEFDAVILPGGMPGSTNLRDDANVVALVREMFAANKVVAAICAAPIVLDRAGLLTDRIKFTGYPGLDELYGANKPNGKVVETDGKIVTGRGPGATFAFAAAVANALGEHEKAAATLQGMLVS